MIVTHKLTMDLTRREKLPCIDVMQDDKYSRDLQIRVKSNGIRCRLPEDCSVLIRYEKPDETKGFYDTMPDGSRAWSVGEAELTVRLAPQVCTVPGKVKLMVTLLRAEAELNFFEMELNVHKRCAGEFVSENYINVERFAPSRRQQRPVNSCGCWLRTRTAGSRR